MVDITNLNQVAQEQDRLMPSWVNAAKTAIDGLRQELAYVNQQLTDLKSKVSQAFQVTPIVGLTAAVAGGAIKVGSSNAIPLVLTVANTTITLQNNATSVVYIDETGKILVSTNRPSTGLEIATVITSNGSIVSVQNYPLFEVRPAAPNLSNYATIEYANSRSWESVAVARKASTFSVPAKDIYYIIPFESLKGTGFNTGGTFTYPLAGRYIFHADVRVDTLAPQTSPDLSVKLSLFHNNDEVCILQQSESARGDISLNGANPEPITATAKQQANIRVYLTEGFRARVRENSVVQVWRLPD